MKFLKTLLINISLLAIGTISISAVNSNHLNQINSCKRDRYREEKQYLYEETIQSQTLTDEEYHIITSDGKKWFADNKENESWVGDGVRVARKWGWRVGDRLGFENGETFQVYIVTNLDRRNSKMHVMVEGRRDLPNYHDDSFGD